MPKMVCKVSLKKGWACELGTGDGRYVNTGNSRNTILDAVWYATSLFANNKAMVFRQWNSLYSQYFQHKQRSCPLCRQKSSVSNSQNPSWALHMRQHTPPRRNSSLPLAGLVLPRSHAGSELASSTRVATTAKPAPAKRDRSDSLRNCGRPDRHGVWVQTRWIWVA